MEKSKNKKYLQNTQISGTNLRSYQVMLLQYEVTNAPLSVQLSAFQAISSFFHQNFPNCNVTFC